MKEENVQQLGCEALASPDKSLNSELLGGTKVPHPSKKTNNNTNSEELELNILRRAENVKNQQSLAKELGFSVGKINYVLKSLVQKGFIKAENFANSTNKKQYKYLLTPKGIQAKFDLTKKYIEYKKQEYEELQWELEKMREENENRQ